MHLADDTVRTVLDLVGVDHVAFVSDAMAAAGVGDGGIRPRRPLGRRRPGVALGGLRDPDDTAPGSITRGTSHVADIVTRVVAAGTPLAYAVRPATRTPARALGLADRGSLAAGSRADVVVVDADARPTRVMRRGRWLDAALP